MKNRHHQTIKFRPAVSPASGVAFLLAFLLATHVFWCALAAPLCESGLAHETTTHVALTGSVAPDFAVTHSHFDTDICAGLDEAKSRASAAVSPFVAPILIWVALAFLAATLALNTALQRAAVFGRDGPTEVPPLHSRLVRASLPHRAPPVFLF